MTTGARQAEIQRVCRAYLQQTRALTPGELRANQDAPWASIAFGAAGIAAAQWRAGHVATAKRWLRDATASRARDAFSPRASVYDGRDGAELVRHLIDGRRFLPFLARCRRTRQKSSELLYGAAGHLNALVMLWTRTRDERVREGADELARHLLERRGWTRAPRLAFAHGRAGTFHALLGWSLACERSLPEDVFDDLARLARDLERDGTMGAASTNATRRRSWCNGAAGLVLLWARAYERRHDETYLHHARKSARFALTGTKGAPGDLCCGLGGRAYALLAMDRVAPRDGWLEHARRMASRAVAAMLRDCGPWPNGLYKGYPGLVCLAFDLETPRAKRVGFPLVEGWIR